MRTALLFPGQGSQAPGMGRAFYEAWPEMRTALDDLDAAAGIDLPALCFGDDDRLDRTEYTQPAVFAVGAAVAAALADRYAPRPALVAGHSLGHVTAAAHGGLLAPADGVELVAERGGAMARAAAADGPGEMVAVLLAPAEVVEEACAATDGVAVAAYNTDRQTVISGAERAVERARGRIANQARARFAELDVGAAFHSPVMAAAEDAVAAAVRETPMADADVPIVSDISGEAYTDPATGRAALRAQVQSPVDWVAVTRTLRARGIERVVELPPAGTLAGFVARTAPEIAVEPLDDPADAAAVFE